MAHLPRVALAAAVILLTASVESWESSDNVSGTMRASSAPGFLTLTASFESEGEYNGDSDDRFEMYVLLGLSGVIESDECVDLTVIVRDEAGEVRVDDARADHEECNSLLLSSSAQACAGQLPGRCDLTFEVEISSPEELDIAWFFEANVIGNLYCNRDAPPTTVHVESVDAPN